MLQRRILEPDLRAFRADGRGQVVASREPAPALQLQHLVIDGQPGKHTAYRTGIRGAGIDCQPDNSRIIALHSVASNFV